VYSKLHIFTGEGCTFTFENATDVTSNESGLVFDYVAMSDGRVKRGVFHKSNIVGYSHTLPDGE
jgi:hypothetical protein